MFVISQVVLAFKLLQFTQLQTKFYTQIQGIYVSCSKASKRSTIQAYKES